MKNVLLSIGGYDPTSGAGTVLDVNVFQSLGFYGMGIVTALTAQNTRGVDSISNLPADWLRAQFQTRSEDIVFSGIKVGMVGHRENIPIIKEILCRYPSLPRIIDPVFRSSSGTWLLEKENISEFIDALSGHLSLLTPNADEASLISAFPVFDLDDMKHAAKKISALFRAPCLITGGHLVKKTADVLYDGKNFHLFEHTRLDMEVHGSGCFFSSSLLAFLCQEGELKKACQLAVDYTLKNLRRSSLIGRGQRLFFFGPTD